MAGEDQSEMGVKHLQVRLSTGEYNKVVEAAGDVALQRFIRNAIMRDADPDATQPDPLASLSPKHRAVATKLIDLLRSDDLTQQQRDNLATSVNSVLKLLTGGRD